MSTDPSSFALFTNSEPSGPNSPGKQSSKRMEPWPSPPPWRRFLSQEDLDQAIPEPVDTGRWNALEQLMAANKRDTRRGSVFRLPESEEGERIRLAVNAAIHLRRPLLVSGDPGSGKTSLAYAIAWELGLGPVLAWPINPRSRLKEDGLYSYDALGRLQDTRLEQPEAQVADGGWNRPIGDYITLGPVGTAFLPSRWPRVLLIDEIDKSDLQLPNELLNLFEEGEYRIDELVRHAAQIDSETTSASLSADQVELRTADGALKATVGQGRVRCHEFPIVVMTSNREREFPPAFNRRCLRIDMPRPTKESFVPLVKAHFEDVDADVWGESDATLLKWIGEFLGPDNKGDQATDQLLNALYLRTHPGGSKPSESQMQNLRSILYKSLSEPS